VRSLQEHHRQFGDRGTDLVRVVPVVQSDAHHLAGPGDRGAKSLSCRFQTSQRPLRDASRTLSIPPEARNAPSMSAVRPDRSSDRAVLPEQRGLLAARSADSHQFHDHRLLL
jgi:hypothetical protein